MSSRRPAVSVRRDQPQPNCLGQRLVRNLLRQGLHRQQRLARGAHIQLGV